MPRRGVSRIYKYASYRYTFILQVEAHQRGINATQRNATQRNATARVCSVCGAAESVMSVTYNTACRLNRTERSEPPLRCTPRPRCSVRCSAVLVTGAAPDSQTLPLRRDLEPFRSLVRYFASAPVQCLFWGCYDATCMYVCMYVCCIRREDTKAHLLSGTSFLRGEIG